MKTWKIVLIVVSCIAAIAVITGVVLVVTSRISTGPTKEELLVATVHANYPQTTDTPDSRIINIAKDTCQILDDGLSVKDAIRIISFKYPITVEQGSDVIAYTMAEGIRQLCPEHVTKAREFSNG